jgi:serine/threonine protein kinase
LGGLPPFLPEEVGRGVPLEFPSPEFDNVSEEAKKLITAMLNDDPKQRPTIEEIVNHPWYDFSFSRITFNLTEREQQQKESCIYQVIYFH